MADTITEVIHREGDDKETNDSADKGGRTKYGISEKANPDLWKDGPPTEEQSRQRYEERYVKGPGFDKINDKQLQTQLIDFGVNSGPAVAVKKLQEILHVTVDGELGPETLAALKTMHAEDINNALAIKRILMIGRIVQNSQSQLKFLEGWLDRACQFIR